MPKRDWGNGLAIGLIVGGGLTISLMVVVIGLNYCPGEPCNYTRFGLSEPSMAQGKPRETVSEPQTAQGQPTEKPAVEAPSNDGNPTAAYTSGENHDAQIANSSQDQGTESYFPFLADGAAQWIMAVFGIVAVGVSWWAVHLVGKSLEATNEAIKAAKEANGIAQAIGEAQAKAYLSVQEAEVEIGRMDATGDTLSLTLEFTIKNSGQSPAHDIRVKVVWNRKAHETMSLSDISAHDSEPMKIRTKISANALLVKKSSTPTVELWAEVTIKYRTEFSKPGEQGETLVRHYRFEVELADKFRTQSQVFVAESFVVPRIGHPGLTEATFNQYGEMTSFKMEGDNEGD